MKLSVYSLILEVTRKCNMKCEHCLRGNAQNKSMTYDVLYKTLRRINYISYVTFSGGEPTLNMDIIDDFINYCIWHSEDIEVDSFYIVTNGKVFRQRLIDLCDILYNRVCTNNECSGLAVSDDMFHRVYQPEWRRWVHNRNRYVYEDEWCEIKRPYARPRDKDISSYGAGMINQGRAKANGLGVRDLTEETVRYVIHHDEMQITEGLIYITVDGDVIVGCDWSYEEMPDHCIGNVNDWDGVIAWIRENGECEFTDEEIEESEEF